MQSKKDKNRIKISEIALIVVISVTLERLLNKMLDKVFNVSGESKEVSELKSGTVSDTSDTEEKIKETQESAEVKEKVKPELQIIQDQAPETDLTYIKLRLEPSELEELEKIVDNRDKELGYYIPYISDSVRLKGLNLENSKNDKFTRKYNMRRINRDQDFSYYQCTKCGEVVQVYNYTEVIPTRCTNLTCDNCIKKADTSAKANELESKYLNNKILGYEDFVITEIRSDNVVIATRVKNKNKFILPASWIRECFWAHNTGKVAISNPEKSETLDINKFI
jgi:hypothetical protein